MPTTLRNTDILFNDSTTQSSGQQAAKAWVNFDGASGTRRSFYNVSSVTRNGTGDYTVNFTNAFSDTNYTIVFGASGVAGGGNSTGKLGINDNVATPLTTTSARIIYVGTAFIDPTFAYVAVFR